MKGAAAAIDGGGGIGTEGCDELSPVSLLLDILPTIYSRIERVNEFSLIKNRMEFINNGKKRCILCSPALVPRNCSNGIRTV